MAEIAGITIAATTLLILIVGIACCLIFVRRRNKRLEQEDRKGLIHEHSATSHHDPHVLSAPSKDFRSETTRVGIIPLQRDTPESQPSQEQPRTWPRYYPVIPDERAIEAIVNRLPPRPADGISCSTQSKPLDKRRDRRPQSNGSGFQQTTRVYLPLPPSPPTQARTKPSKLRSLTIPQNQQPRIDFSPTSAETDFEEDDASLRPRSNFAGSRPMSCIDYEWPKPPVSPTTASTPLSQKRTSRPPALSIAIPKALQIVSTMPPLAPQRPSLARHGATKRVPILQWPLPPPSQSQQSSYSSAIASSQALGASISHGTSQSSNRSESNYRLHSNSSARSESQASYTSFESTGSDDDSTPPRDEEKCLSLTHERRVSYPRYPKVPRESNQVVPRTSPSNWSKKIAVPSLGSPFMESQGSVLAVDLLNPTPAAEARKHKLKQLVPGPRSFFMDVKCPGCFTITTVFSHAQTVVVCAGCSQVLCQPTGGKARLTEGCSFRRK
ncbi:hypothetical protein FKW77_000484 [Venturia effusa]|uniref:40S ribosomal protein S27 n=1 Tax=Venturia effusa TaxID=50376 RepID=A0A517LNA0_9PEZI|nr:hypothetical protein FKW77_000484 [Venturia effusa]